LTKNFFSQGQRKKSEWTRHKPKMDPIVQLFEELADNLDLIKEEVKQATRMVEAKRKGVVAMEARRRASKFVMDGIHRVLDAQGGHKGRCKKAEEPCLKELIDRERKKGERGVENLKIIIPLFAKVIPALYPNLQTRANKFSNISTFIKKRFPQLEDLANDNFHVTREEHAELIKHANKKVFDRNAKQIEIVDAEVLRIINDLRWVPANLDWTAQFIFIGLATGARLIEIAEVSRFEAADNPMEIRVVGVAKDPNDKAESRLAEDEDKEDKKDKKEDDQEDKKRIITKPIVGGPTGKEIVEKVEKLRQELARHFNLDELEERRQVTNLLDHALNKRIKQLFGEQFTFHSTRGIYATLAYAFYAPNDKSPPVYFSEILGHQKDSMNSALSYQVFTLKRAIAPSDPALHAAVTALKSKIESLEEQVAMLQAEQPIPEQPSDSKIDDPASAGPPAKKQRTLPVKGINLGVVYFKDRNGKNIPFYKHRRNYKAPQAEKEAAVKEAAQWLRSHGLSATYRNLKKCGFGADIVAAVKRKNEA